MKKYLIISVVLILAACAAKKTTQSQTSAAVPTESDYLASAQKIDPSMTSETFSLTKNIFETECNRCHGLKKPASRTPEAWQTIVPDMVKKANRKGAAISPEQEKNLLTYILAVRETGM
jgi:hypothetical protein